MPHKQKYKNTHSGQIVGHLSHRCHKVSENNMDMLFSKISQYTHSHLFRYSIIEKSGLENRNAAKLSCGSKQLGDIKFKMKYVLQQP